MSRMGKSTQTVPGSRGWTGSKVGVGAEIAKGYEGFIFCFWCSFI